MQPAVLRPLEFDRVVEMVRGFAMTPMGDERLSRLLPSGEPQKVAQLLAATTETAKYLAANCLLPLRSAAEMPQIVAALAVEGRAIEASRLLALATLLGSVDDAVAAIRRAPGSYARLEAASGPARTFQNESAQVREKIDEAGEVVDGASPELKAIREKLRKQRTRLRRTLGWYLRGKETAKGAQEP